MKKEWYELYEVITNLLVDFHEKCREKKLHSGKEFYRLCTQAEHGKEFFKLNPWAQKFESLWKVSSIDPLHIFASFNNWKIPTDKRRRKLNFYYKVLNQGRDFKDLIALTDNELDVFKQFPHVQITRIVSARGEDEQRDIWDFFYNAVTKTTNLDDFDELLGYYGVGFSSLTIFLFWIKSDRFLPLDKNTTALLLNINKHCINSYNCKTYKKLLTPALNETGMLYRNLAVIAIDFAKQIERLEQSELLEEAKEVRNYFQYIKKIGKDDFNKKKLFDQLKKEKTSKKGIKSEIVKENIRRFSIFAIRPLTGCSIKYRKTLDENTVYYLNKTYSIQDEETIIYNSDNDIDIYTQGDALKININAIVGKNGTGKSSLMELLLLIINNLTVSYNADIFKDLEKVDDSLEAELFVSIGKPYKIIYRDNSVHIYKYETIDNETYIQNSIEEENFLEDFFYTIYSNYSIYSLNASKEGFSWLKPLFHKNDAYQTPVVIEPLRTDGNFNINSIEYLGKNRLLYKCLLPFDEEEIKSGYKLVTETKGIERIELKRNNLKIEKMQEILPNISSKYIKLILENYKISTIIDVNDLNTDIASLCAQYVIYKVLNINKTYQNIYGFELDSSETLEAYLLRLGDDNSHVTNKLWQAINFYRYFDELNKIYNIENGKMNLYDLSNAVEKFKHENGLELIKIIPPSFIEPIFYLHDIKTNKKDIPFDTLSSGEMQSIITINSILYHILNLDSVHLNKHKDKKILIYRNVNIVLDEIELYHHPEMQRRFIFILLNAIKSLDEVNEIYELNIILITHSTFILSDVVSTNALLMGNDKQEITLPTFASNIHTLLSKSFFMKNGLIGQFAKSKIDELIETLNSSRMLSKDMLNECKYLISVIGEPIIKKQLQRMLDSKLIDNIKQNKVERSELIDDVIYAINDNEELKKYLIKALNK